MEVVKISKHPEWNPKKPVPVVGAAVDRARLPFHVLLHGQILQEVAALQEMRSLPTPEDKHYIHIMLCMSWLVGAKFTDEEREYLWIHLPEALEGLHEIMPQHEDEFRQILVLLR